MRRTCTLVILMLMVFVMGCSRKDKKPTAPGPQPVALISYPNTSTGGDNVGRGFFITSYPGTSLSSVSVWLATTTAGTYTFRMIARDGAYDGPVIDSTRTTIVLTSNTADTVRTTFNFSNAAVTKTHTVTFAITILGGPSNLAFFDVFGDYGGLAGAAIGVVETQGQNPPLDSHLRDGIAIVVRGLP